MFLKLQGEYWVTYLMYFRNMKQGANRQYEKFPVWKTNIRKRLLVDLSKLWSLLLDEWRYRDVILTIFFGGSPDAAILAKPYGTLSHSSVKLAFQFAPFTYWQYWVSGIQDMSRIFYSQKEMGDLCNWLVYIMTVNCSHDRWHRPMSKSESKGKCL